MYQTATGTQLRLSGATTTWSPAHSPGASLVGTSGNNLFYMQPGDRIAGGLGDDQYHSWTTNFTIIEAPGAGVDTLYSYAWGAAVLPDNVENLFLMDQGSTSGTGNALDNIVAAGAVGAWIDGGKGNDVLVGGAGRDTFQVKAGNGSDAVEHFTPGSDVVRLEGYGVTSFADLMSHASQIGTDVRFALPNGEALVIRDTQLSQLDATGFRLANNVTGTLAATAFDAPAAGSGLSQMVGPAQCYTAKGWYVLNNTWGSGSLAYGTDYKMTDTYHAGDLTGGTTFNWTYPVIATSPNTPPTILAYPEVIFGGAPYGTGYDETDAHNVFPVQLSSLTSLRANYDVSFGGDTRGYDVAYDIFLTNHPHGLAADISNEVMIWLHQGDFKVYGDVVGTYQDGDFAATIYHQAGTPYTAVVANSDAPVGDLDITGIFAKLEELGIVSPNEYLADVELGAEVVSGQGFLTVNNLDLTVQTANADGSITTKVVTGSGTTETTVAPPPPPPVGPTEGDDTLSLGDGGGTLHGLGGNDTLTGGAGADLIDGGAGDDTLAGGAGDDVYVVDSEGDKVTELAGGGVDTVQTSLASYWLGTGSEIENLTYTGAGAAVLSGNELDNVITGGAGADHISGEDGNDKLIGGDGNDQIDGGAGNDTVLGGLGNDILIGNIGDDMLRGGAGNDIYIVDAGDTIEEAAGGGFDTVLTDGSFTLAAGQEIEALQARNTASTNAINLTGNEFANLLVGNAGANTLDGRGGADTMIGGAGDDTYVVDNAGNKIAELAGGGVDTVQTSLASYALGVNVENLVYTGSAATVLSGNALDNVISGGASDNRIWAGAGNDTLIGGGGNDQLNGADGNDTLIGGDGNDILIGGLDSDVLKGGAGNDIYIVDSADTVEEAAGGGVDSVLTEGSFTLAAGQEIENLQARYTASTNAMDLTGNEFANLLVGNAGANMLDGGDGADRLIGGAGVDQLRGGDGADRFIFGDGDTSNTDATADTILDFSHAQGDKIDLSRIDANALSAGNQAFTFHASGDDHVAGALWLATTGDATTINLDLDGDGIADYLLHVASQSSTPLLASDLVF